MATRNFNNTTAVGVLTAPVAPSAVFVTVSGFTNPPAAPFTVTLDRNTGAEEVCLVTAVNGGVLTVTRGYNGTAAQTHLAGATLEHTAVALDFTEANSHVNATSGVHGTGGSLVGTEGAQTLLDKTLVGALAEADDVMGDAFTAYVPEGVDRNMYAGMDANGDTPFYVNKDGQLTADRVQSTGDSETDGNHRVDGNLSVGGTSTFTGAATFASASFSGAVTVPAPTQAGNPARKSDVDAVNTAVTNEVTARTNADTGLTNRLNALPNKIVAVKDQSIGTLGPGVTMFTVTIPAGKVMPNKNYIVMAHAHEFVIDNGFSAATLVVGETFPLTGTTFNVRIHMGNFGGTVGAYLDYLLIATS